MAAVCHSSLGSFVCMKRVLTAASVGTLSVEVAARTLELMQALVFD